MIVEVEKLIIESAKEFDNERFSWVNVSSDEVGMVKSLLEKKPLLAVYLSKAIVGCLSERLNSDVHSNNNKSLQVVNEKLDQIVKKVKPDLDMSDCRSAEDIALKSLGAIQATLNVASDIKNLNKAIEQFEESIGIQKQGVEEEPAIRIKTIKESLNEARSLKDIIE